MANASESSGFGGATDDQPRGALAVIPARAGSKRLPGKNIRVFCGLPAIAYTIAAARDSGLFSLVIVSTDNETIAEIAVHYGADVPFLRAAALADDRDAGVERDRGRVDARGSGGPAIRIRRATDAQLSAARRRGCARQLRAVHRDASRPRSCRSRGSAGRRRGGRCGARDDFTLAPLFPREAVMRGQDLPPLFCPTGAIWWARADTLREAGTFHVPGRTGWEIDPVHAVDIDTEDDWRLAEALMAQRSQRRRQPARERAPPCALNGLPSTRPSIPAASRISRAGVIRSATRPTATSTCGSASMRSRRSPCPVAVRSAPRSSKRKWARAFPSAGSIARPGDTPARLRQRALAEMVTSYDRIVFVDADDLLQHSRVAAAREALATCDVVGCALRLIDERGVDMGVTFGLESVRARGSRSGGAAAARQRLRPLELRVSRVRAGALPAGAAPTAC